MKEYIKFFKESGILFAIGFILGFELFLQAGCYDPMLKKNSYAGNAHRVVNQVINKLDEFQPEILIAGTSVAHEGLSPRLLTEFLKEKNLKVHTIALPASEPIVMQLALHKILKKYKGVKYLINVSEIDVPWGAQPFIHQHTMNMILQFDKLYAYKLIPEYEYTVFKKGDPYVEFIRTINYNKDIGDLILSPDTRIPAAIKINNQLKKNIYFYENTHEEKLSLYNATNIPDCVNKSLPTSPIPNGSDVSHRTAIYDTCKFIQPLVDGTGKYDNENKNRYFRRLAILYKYAKENNIKIINVFLPGSKLLMTAGYQERVNEWKQNLEKLKPDYIYDLFTEYQDLEREDMYYDIIHPNKKGMEFFTKSVAEKILKEEGIQ